MNGLCDRCGRPALHNNGTTCTQCARDLAAGTVAFVYSAPCTLGGRS